MVLVIIGHAIQCVLGDGCFDNHIWNMIYSFHMPAFMAVSGWFAYRQSTKTDWLGACGRRFGQILIPYFVWSFIVFLQKGNYTMTNLSKMILYPDNYFWFLWVLFWICVLFEFAKMIASKLMIDEIIPIGICCLSLFVVMITCEIRVFGYQFLSYYFLFYTLGYCIHRYPLLQVKRTITLLCLVLLWGVLAWSWKMHDLPTWIPAIPHVPSSLMQYSYRGFSAFVAIVFMFGLAPKVLNRENTINGYVVEIGKYSLGIYVIHLVLMGYISLGIEHLTPQISLLLKVALISIIDFVLSLSIVELIKRNKYTSKILLGK